jgi:hypothetical protein
MTAWTQTSIPGPTLLRAPVPATLPAPMRGSAAQLMERARVALREARLEQRAADRYQSAHLAALRAAAAVLASRARPATSARRRPTSAWVLLEAVAPELADWSAYFADSANRRAAIDSGALSVVSDRDADDLIRGAGEFIGLAGGMLGLLEMRFAS